LTFVLALLVLCAVICMPLLDNAARSCRSTTRCDRLTNHLNECRVEINNLYEKNRRLQNELNEVSEERNKKRAELASLKDKLRSYVVGLFWTRPIKPNLPPPAIARKKLVTLAQIIDDPGEFVEHIRCEVDGHEIFCAGGH
jgi:hypothetical protein